MRSFQVAQVKSQMKVERIAPKPPMISRAIAFKAPCLELPIVSTESASKVLLGPKQCDKPRLLKMPIMRERIT